MKAIATKKTRTVNSHEFKGSKFKLDNESSQLFEILRSKIYQDKILAVIREYSCNALDAHVEAGVNKPITITLPSALNPHFKVRDYGKGLDEEGMLEIYATYGVSTKRNTNTQIGQLGLGCKSGFAYGSSFLVTSFYKGYKNIYNCSLDETNIGQMSKLSSDPSDEPSGIEVSINVQNDDYEQFLTKSRDFFQHWIDNRPDIQGIDEKEFWSEIGPKNEIVKGDGYVFYEGQNHAVAVMGNVPYSINLNALEYPYNSTEYKVIEAHPTLYFEIGELAVTASREGLEYNELTKKSLKARVSKIKKELGNLLSKKFDECGSMWEAKLLFEQTFNSGLSAFRDIIKGCPIKYKGKTLSDSHYDFGDVAREMLKVYHFHKHHRGKRVKSEDTKKILVKSSALLIYDDVKQHQGRLNRIAPIFEDFSEKQKIEGVTDCDYEDVYLVRAEGKSGQLAIKHKKLDCPYAVKLSSLPKYVLRDIYPSNSTVRGGTATTKNKKHGKKVFVYDNSEQNSFHHYTRSDFFKSATLDFSSKKEIVYNYVNRFEVPCVGDSIRHNRNASSYCHTHPRGFQDSKNLLKSLGVKVPTVYFVKKPHWDLVDKKTEWITYGEFYERSVNEILCDSKRVNELYNSALVHYHINNLNNAVKEILLHLDASQIVSDDSPAKKWREAVDEMQMVSPEKVLEFNKICEPLWTVYNYKRDNSFYYASTKEFLHFANFLKQVAKKKNFVLMKLFKLDDLYENVTKRYPILESLQDSAKEHFLNLVNVFDVTYVSKKKITNRKPILA